MLPSRSTDWRSDSSRAREALHRGDDEVDSLHRLAKTGRVADVSAHQFHVGVECPGMGGEASAEHADRNSTLAQ